MKIKVPKFLKRKRNIWIIAILVVVIIAGYFIFGKKNNAGSIQTGFAAKQNLEATVLATGQVVSGTDLDLSFQGSGITRRVLVKEGDKVIQGQLLAALDQSSALAALTTVKGALAQAQANYDKLLAGATQQNIQVYKDSALVAEQDLKTANNSSLNYLNDAYTKIYNAYTTATTIQNTYFSTSDQQGIKVQDSRNNVNANLQNVKIYLDAAQKSMSQGDIDAAIFQTVFSLNKVYNDINIIRAQCDEGIYYSTVTSADKTLLDTQKGYINTALTNVTTSSQSIASYKIAVQKAEDQLSVTTAPPTQADIDLYKAQILSAQGQVESAQVVLNNLLRHLMQSS